MAREPLKKSNGINISFISYSLTIYVLSHFEKKYFTVIVKPFCIRLNVAG